MSTIAAISTGVGIGGIGIIRLSGKESFNIISKIFKPINSKSEEIKGYNIKYGHVINPSNNQTIDEVLVSYFKAPKSYTTEDMCEINSHGGTIVMQKILEVCLENGAILAEPGEFTKRAFLNGRIDLSQAEAVIDILNAKTEKESKASLKQLEGFLSKELQKIKVDILEILAIIEANIDYPEYDVDEITNEEMIQRLDVIEENLRILETSFENGKIIREGLKVAIIGKPNAGKSSLLNSILKEERAIVTEIEGTTRDTIEEFISIDGIPFKIIDTAGIREAKDEIEKIGINKSKKMAEEADLVIWIIDITQKLNKDDLSLLELIRDTRSIILLNKLDLAKTESDIETQIVKEIEGQNVPILKISAKENEGIEKLYEKISEIFKLGNIDIENEVMITNMRHKNLIIKAKEACNEAKLTIEASMPLDLVAINIKDILESLGEITGENVSEDIIKEIFARFCLGK